jgi:hypothetical protein
MFITRCDRCGRERGGKIQGWAKVSVYTRANREDMHIDLCSTCATEMLVVLRIQSGQPEQQVGKGMLDQID